MKTTGFKLVGIRLASSSILNTYRIDNVYRPALSAIGKCITIQSGLDARQHIDYQDIERALCNAYAPWIAKIWRRRFSNNQETYFQLHKYASPSLVKLAGTWRLWAIL